MTTDGLARFNAWPEGQARTALTSCLSVPRWASEVLAGRPYRSEADIRARASSSAAGLTPSEVQEAVAGHPRIGERAGPGHDVVSSEREQAAVGRAGRAVQDTIRSGNQAYEQRFGRVFLIRAQGREPEEILSELSRRLGSDDATEFAEVVIQLGEIALARLEHLLQA